LQFHPEKLPSAIDRYKNEIKRVWGVIDYQLNKTGKPYLVGDNVCFADLMFVTWNNLAVAGAGQEFADELKAEKPKAWEWHQRLLERESVKTMEQAKAAASKQ